MANRTAVQRRDELHRGELVALRRHVAAVLGTAALAPDDWLRDMLQIVQRGLAEREEQLIAGADS